MLGTSLKCKDCDRDSKRFVTVQRLTYHKWMPKGQNMAGLRPPARVGIDYFNHVVEIVLRDVLSEDGTASAAGCRQRRSGWGRPGGDDSHSGRV